MVVVFWIGWALGERVATVLFALISFLALREFITLSPTRRGDHRSLVLAFFVVLPIQFWLVGTRALRPVHRVHPGLCVPRASRWSARWPTTRSRFLERNAKLQWGIMVCVYGMSHVPALLLLDFPRLRGQERLPGVLPGVRGADLHAGAAPRGSARAVVEASPTSAGDAPATSSQQACRLLRRRAVAPQSAAASLDELAVGLRRELVGACSRSSRRSSPGRRWRWR